MNAADHPELPLWELIQTSHLVARRFTEVFAEAELTPTQFGVLAALADDDDLSPADLARMVLVRPQSMRQLVTSLISRGLVHQPGAGGRGKRSRLHLTDAGRDALRRALPAVYAINAPAAIGLDAADAAALIRHLRAVRSSLSR